MTLEGEGPVHGNASFPFGGVLDQFVAGRQVRWIDDTPAKLPGDTEAVAVALSCRQLQDLPDYRQALRRWFDQVAIGGHLIVIVPHAFLHERRLALPSPWRPGQRRLYTPASLLTEVEEALVPNSYRVRWLGDLDRGYDYGLDPHLAPSGDSDVALVLERIALPVWSLVPTVVAPAIGPAAEFGRVPLDTPDYAFEPARTRIEIDATPPIRRVLILKLDHLGDFIMGLPALERARRLFADATIDLVVGSWNADMARGLGVADRVIAFDAFPRNSSEHEPDVHATLDAFRATVTGDYDLAIDLRTDLDTRILLRAARAPLKAGIGIRARFPFLDIALPLDGTRNEAERVRDERIGHQGFSLQGSGRRGHFALYSDRETVERDYAIVWGPYLELDPGDYLFDFYLDLEERRGDGLLRLDVALDHGRRVAEMIVSGPARFHLPFRVDAPGTVFEARIATVDDYPSISFGFHGGRLIKRGPGNVLHQTEYACLLIELVKLRLRDFGTARELGGSADEA